MNEAPGSSDLGPALGEVRSADGAAIGYQRVGSGPAVVLLHGAGPVPGNLIRPVPGVFEGFTGSVAGRRGGPRRGGAGERRAVGGAGSTPRLAGGLSVVTTARDDPGKPAFRGRAPGRRGSA